MPARSHSKKHKEGSGGHSAGDQADASQAQGSGGGKHWQSIRPWRPPEGLQDGSSDQAEPSKLQVEVIDVASTAVALAFFASDSTAPATPIEEEIVQEARADASTSQGHNTQHTGSTTTSSLTVKLNSNPWPHVLHSDPAFFQDVDFAGDGNALQHQQGATTIVIYGLDPGTSYQIELEWVPQHEADGLVTADDDASPSPLSTRPIVISTHSSSGASTPSHNHDSFYGPPPPYSSHDPSTPDASPAPNTPAATSPPASLVNLRSTEAELKANLAALKERVKLTESNLNAPLASLKRSFEKSAKEDQRARQRISTLEEATRKLKLLAVEEADLADTMISEEVEPLQAEATELSAKLEERRAHVHKVEGDSKKSMRADEEAVRQLEQELAEAEHHLEDMTTDRRRYEEEVIPDLTRRSESLAEELKLMEHGEYQAEQYQHQQHQMAAAAASSPWYNFGQHSNSSTSLHAFPGSPVVYQPPPTGSPSVSRWPSLNLQQRAALRSAPSDSAAGPDWPTHNMRSRMVPRADSLEARLQSDNQHVVPGLLPRFASDPTQMTTAASSALTAPIELSTTTPSNPESADSPASLAPAPSAGSRFLSGFRKRSFSAQPKKDLSMSELQGSETSAASGQEEANKKGKEHAGDGMLSGLGSKLTRPGSSDSQSSSHTSKMSWSRVVGGKGRNGPAGQAAAPSS